MEVTYRNGVYTLTMSFFDKPYTNHMCDFLLETYIVPFLENIAKYLIEKRCRFFGNPTPLEIFTSH